VTRRNALVLTAILVACGGATPHPEAIVTTSTNVPATPPSWHLYPRVGSSEAFRVFVADAGSWIGATGRTRIRIGADRTVTHAAQPLAHRVAAMAPMGDAWVIVTDAGEVFRASDALGAVSPVGTLGSAALGAVLATHARLALVDTRGRLFVGDASGIESVSSDTATIAAAFVDASFGVRVDLGGSVLRTSDGGRSWSAVADARAPTATAAWVAGTDVVVATADGALRVGAASATLVDGLTPPARLEAPDDVSALVSASMSWGLSTTLTASGRGLVDVGERRYRVFPLTADAPVIDWNEDCTSLVAWGERFATSCDDGVNVTDGAGPFARFGPANGTPYFDWRGERYAFAASCSREHYVAGALCVVERDGTMRDVLIGENASLLGMSGDAAIVHRCDDAGCGDVRVDLAHGDRIEPLPPGDDDAYVTIGPSGILVARSDAHPWRILLDGAWTDVAAPEGTTTLAVADATHVVATSADDAWLSDDGGRTFHAIELPSSGIGASVANNLCSPAACELGGWVWSPRDLDALMPQMAMLDGAPNVPAWSSVRRTIIELAARCDAPPTPPTYTPVLAGGGLVALTETAAHRWVSGAVRGRLRGIDDAGPFDVALHGGTVPALAGARRGETVYRSLVGMTRQIAVLARCANERCDLVALPVASAPRVLGTAAVLAGAPDASVGVADAMPLPDGSLALTLVRTGPDEPDGSLAAPSPTAILVVHPDGTTQVATLATGLAPALVTLARRSDGVAALLVVNGSEARLVAFDGSVSAPVPAPHGVVRDACGARRDGDVDYVAAPFVTRVEFRLGDGLPTQESAVATLHADGTSCLAAIDAREGSGSAVIVRAIDGALVGTAIGTDASTTLACTSVAPD
jgi:hypothetical protein